MKSSNNSVDSATRVVTAVLMMVIVLFVGQLLLVQHTGLKIALSVILIVVMGAALGWLVTSLSQDRHDPAGHE